MSNVIFDHNVFVRAKRGGVARYFCNIISHLAGADGVSDRIPYTVMAPFHNNDMLSELESGLFQNKVPAAGKYASKLMDLADEQLLRIALIAGKPRVLHETHYSGRSYGRGKPSPIFTVHDLIPELHPEWLPGYDKIRSRRQKAFTMDANFVCVSNKTADDFLRLFRVSSGSVHVIPHGTTYLTKPADVVRRDDMILYVGARGGYKNFLRLIEAFGRTPFLANSIELVAFGGGAFNAEELKALSENGVRRSRQIGGDDTALARAYSQATAFVYPSLYEGFGLPLLEAMALDCPVACANASCFPEIADTAAAYFAPNDAGAIGEVLKALVNDPSWRDDLVNRGRQRVSAYSWRKSAAAHAALYKTLI